MEYSFINLLLKGFVCPNCNNTYDNDSGIYLSDSFTHDLSKCEYICNKCGMVVKSQDIPTINDLEYLIYHENSIVPMVETNNKIINCTNNIIPGLKFDFKNTDDWFKYSSIANDSYEDLFEQSKMESKRIKEMKKKLRQEKKKK